MLLRFWLDKPKALHLAKSRDFEDNSIDGLVSSRIARSRNLSKRSHGNRSFDGWESSSGKNDVQLVESNRVDLDDVCRLILERVFLSATDLEMDIDKGHIMKMSPTVICSFQYARALQQRVAFFYSLSLQRRLNNQTLKMHRFPSSRLGKCWNRLIISVRLIAFSPFSLLIYSSSSLQLTADVRDLLLRRSPYLEAPPVSRREEGVSSEHIRRWERTMPRRVFRRELMSQLRRVLRGPDRISQSCSFQSTCQSIS